MMAARGGEAPVAGEQGRVERFGEGDVGGVMGREVVPKLPDARKQEIVGISTQREVGEVGESHAPARSVDLAGGRIPAEQLRYFDIHQMGRVQRLSGVEQAGFNRIRRRCAKERFEEGRSVDDDNQRSRSARTASAGATDGVILARSSRRERNSSSVGRSAASRISPSR